MAEYRKGFPDQFDGKLVELWLKCAGNLARQPPFVSRGQNRQLLTHGRTRASVTPQLQLNWPTQRKILASESLVAARLSDGAYLLSVNLKKLNFKK